jgi:hypothetical protein
MELSCVPLEIGQPLSETFFYLMLNKGDLSSDRDKCENQCVYVCMDVHLTSA